MGESLQIRMGARENDIISIDPVLQHQIERARKCFAQPGLGRVHATPSILINRRSGPRTRAVER
jgi:hypothetical protein